MLKLPLWVDLTLTYDKSRAPSLGAGHYNRRKEWGGYLTSLDVWRFTLSIESVWEDEQRA